MDSHTANSSANNILLRDVQESDLHIFFNQQLDAEANWMAAFTSKDPTNKDTFMTHWTKILGDTSTIVKTILFAGQIAGHIFSYEDEEFGHPEVSYWLGKDYWGKGIATKALAAFLVSFKKRPLYARVVKDNIGSQRVLEKCGFIMDGEGSGYANARSAEVEEFIFKL